MIKIEVELVLELLCLHKKHILIDSDCVNVSIKDPGLLLRDTFPWKIIHHYNLSTLFATFCYLTLRPQLVKLKLVEDFPQLLFTIV